MDAESRTQFSNWTTAAAIIGKSIRKHFFEKKLILLISKTLWTTTILGKEQKYSNKKLEFKIYIGGQVCKNSQDSLYIVLFSNPIRKFSAY